MNDLRISPISILRKDQLQRVDISAHAVQITVQTPSPASGMGRRLGCVNFMFVCQ